MSMQTRLAQGAAADAEKEWKRHMGMCPACSRVKRDRQALPCGPGAELRNELGQLRAKARSEARADKAPNSDQLTLL